VAPALAAFWQGIAWSRLPNWTASLRGGNEIAYLEAPGLVLRNALFRPAALLVYLGLFTLPLALVALITVFRPRPGAWRGRGALGVGVCGALLLAGLSLRPSADPHPFLLPLLAWNLGDLLKTPLLFRGVLTFLSGLGGVLILVRAIERWREVPPRGAESRFIDLSALAFLVLHIACAQFGDEYLLVFVPFGLILLGGIFAEHETLLPSGSLACLGALLLGIAWTRGALARREAEWKAADLALTLGASPERVDASWEWNCFHGAFDSYLEDIHEEPTRSSLDDGYEGLEDFFARYLGRRAAAAEYVVTAGVPGRPPLPGLEPIGAPIAYRDIFLARKTVVLGRRPGRKVRRRS
jgi:hypothetical protein